MGNAEGVLEVAAEVVATRPVALGHRGAWERLENWFGVKSTFGTRARVSLYRRLAKFAQRGTPVKDNIENMWARSERRKGVERHVLRSLYLRLDDGAKVSTTFAPYIPSMEAILIQAGEEAGSLSTGFAMAATLSEGSANMRSAVWIKMAEPIFLMVLLTIILVVATFAVMPPLMDLVPNIATWPFAPKALHDVAFYVRDWGLVTVAGLVAVGFWLRWLVPNWTGKGRRFCDRYIPPFTIYRSYSNAGFLLALGELTRNGTAIVDAVELMLQPASKWGRWHMNKMLVRLVDGVEPGRAIDVGMLAQDTMDEVEDYMRGSSFTEALASLGEDAVQDGIIRVKRGANVVSGLSLMAVGFMLALIALGPMMLGLTASKQMTPGAQTGQMP